MTVPSLDGRFGITVGSFGVSPMIANAVNVTVFAVDESPVPRMMIRVPTGPEAGDRETIATAFSESLSVVSDGSSGDEHPSETGISRATIRAVFIILPVASLALS